MADGVVKIPVEKAELFVGKDNLINIRVEIARKELLKHPELKDGQVVVDILEAT